MLSDAYEANLYDGDENAVRLPGYRSDAFVDAAIDYLATPRERPFLLFVSVLEPHQQNSRDDFPAPTGYRERYEGRWTPADLQALGGNSAQSLGGYWGMVKRVDEGFGRLLDALRSRGTARQHRRRVHQRPRLSLQDPQRRIQAVRTRGVDPDPAGAVRARASTAAAGSTSWSA